MSFLSLNDKIIVCEVSHYRYVFQEIRKAVVDSCFNRSDVYFVFTVYVHGHNLYVLCLLQDIKYAYVM